MNTSSVQVLLFQHLKNQLPPHLSMVDEVADLLGISNDSAYRRIRGEKPMDLEETHKLCSHFNIPLDRLLHLKSDSFVFSGKLKVAGSANAFEEWLDEVQHQFQVISSFKSRHIYFLMKDISPFVHFLVPELAAFRCFLYLKSVLQDERMKGTKFSLNDPFYEKYVAQGRKIYNLYSQIPTTEIWNIETLNSSLNQINFYVEAGAFVHKNDIRILYAKVEELVNHIERQAELGVKFNIGETPGESAASYRMFINELILGNNTLLAEVGDGRITFLNHSVMYFIATQDERFNNAMFGNMENLMKKSTLISTIGEKDRSGFFNRLRNKIQESIAQLA